MNWAKHTSIAIFLLMISPIAQSTAFQDDNNVYEIEQKNDSYGWIKLSEPIMKNYEYNHSSSIIYSPHGFFNPLEEQIILGPWEELGIKSPYADNLLIIQNSNPDLESLRNYLTNLGIEIIDFIPENSLIVNIETSNNSQIYQEINSIKSIRWISYFPTSWKISPQLFPFLNIENEFIDISVTPLETLSELELFELSIEIGELHEAENSNEICDKFLCQLKSFPVSKIIDLSNDRRIYAIELSSSITVMNSNASIISGIDHANIFANQELTGNGEVIAISDTGLDTDHGDFNGRLRNPVFNLFGPDNSGADKNSGHGTHVTATLLGDGSGDFLTQGMVPESTFNFYQLEVDNSGQLARWGSLYQMFTHSWNNDARIHTNSWGSESLVGQYSADSRSADQFTYDYPAFLVLFSAGDYSNSGVAPPSTAKNVLSIGSSSTGAYDSADIGIVSNFSSKGPTLDGRIKPDLVAPGQMICSARAAEAALASGGICSDTFHSDGTTPLYMTLSGSSMATPVVAGAAAMARQFLREQIPEPISEPRSDLIKALLINGAEDLGESDIPNEREGWGQINLSNSLYPNNNTTSVFYDSGRSIFPGHSFIYTFEMFDDSGFDATLAWNDLEGSATAMQNSSRLINDLDIIITSPDGEIYRGNNFNNGFSIIDGTNDNVNNIERIRLNSGKSGIWTIQVGHSGGFSQDFSLVVSANAQEIFQPDLTVLEDSINTQNPYPLQNEIIAIQLKWSNQATAGTGQYKILLEDLNESETILERDMNNLESGSIISLPLTHSFETTGTHVLRLTLDYLSEVDEFTDENNIFEYSIEVTQIGVRLNALMPDGSIPTLPDEVSDSRFQTLDPSISSSVEFKVHLKNEGTSVIDVGLSISQVQTLNQFGILNSPKDEWTKELNETGPWTLQPFGEEGDEIILTVNFTDKDALISDTSEARYAIPGNFVSDLNLFDINNPIISNSIRLSFQVERVEGLFTIAAGTEELGAEPGSWASFSLSVRNIGNGPTQYSITCETQNRWQIRIANSQSSVYIIDSLSRLEYISLQVKIQVPNAVNGLPASGYTESITCITKSVNDPNLESLEQVTLTVLESRQFSTQVFDSANNPLGPVAIAESRPVQNGDYVSTIMSLNNKGNVDLQFQISALSSQNNWPIQMFDSSLDPPSSQIDFISLTLNPGEVIEIEIRTIVPLPSTKGEINTISVITRLVDGPTVTNGTKLEVKEITTLDIGSYEGFNLSLGKSAISHIPVQNSGNVPLSISLTIGTLPDGWNGGFLTGNSFLLDMNRDSIISVALEIPENIASGILDTVVPIIINSSSPSLKYEIITVNLSVNVLESVWIIVESETTKFSSIDIDDPKSIDLKIKNFGNIDTGVDFHISEVIGWEISSNPSSIENLEIGKEVDVTVTFAPSRDSDGGLQEIIFNANSTVGDISVPISNASIILEVSKSRTTSSGGISGLLEDWGIPSWLISILFLSIFASLILVGFRLRKNSELVSSEEELIPLGSALQSGTKSERMANALFTPLEGDMISGSVSDDEIRDALSISLPDLPKNNQNPKSMPLPVTGLPDGWTMEQWEAYGHIWWEQNGP